MEKSKTNNLFTRRDFLKTGAILSAGIPLLNAGVLAACKQETSSDDLFQLFQNPPVTAKPFVRWWWNGDKLSAKEILRELDIMKEAGIGGVEINPIAFPGGDDLGIPSLQWLSPEWIEMVKTALKGADERGMICDIIVGSGWPFGAEFLEPEERTQLLTETSHKVKGPSVVTLKVADLLKEAAPKIHSSYAGATSELYSLNLAPLQMDTFASSQLVPFEEGKETISVKVPEGEYILYAMVKVTGFQAVINGAPGAAGPVLNHYNPVAVQKFLNRMSDNLFPALAGLKGFRALFCDSMELEGANWCHDFLDEFKLRNNYDLTPYLPFIMYKVGHMGQPVEGAEITQLSGAAKEEVERVRYDFFVTCMDMVRDRFLKPYTAWCNKYKFQSRVQAYGREFHPLEASMEVDIPECETWLWFGDGRKDTDIAKEPNYTNVNKYVASASRLAGKKLVSCEEVTNTGVVFNATLERIKTTGDQSNLSGVTHSVLHGFNYNPVETPLPGWVRYGTYFNERNPWWPYFKLWAAYKTRLSALLQETDFFADIAVLHPLADIWTKYGTQRDPFPNLRYPDYQYRVWEAIHKNGNSCDYTSEGIIQRSTAEKGFLKYNKCKYHTLILLEVESMMPKTVEALDNFVKTGGKVIFVGKEPYKSPGLKNYKEASEKVKQIIAGMKQNNPNLVFTVEAPVDEIAWFKKIQQQCGIKPYMEIDTPNTYVSQIRHQAPGKDIFFISNCNTNEPASMQIRFPESKGNPWLWDAETGERFAYPETSGNQLSIHLAPATSQLIVFDKQSGGKKYSAIPADKPGMELTGWTVKMNHINGQSTQRDVPALVDWSQYPETRNFAGELVYEKQVSVKPGTYVFIDLGKVYGVSEVTLNGEKLGCKWYGRHAYQIPEQVAKARNLTIQVKIVTTLGNYFKSTPENKIGYAWTEGQEWQPEGMLGPVKLI